MPTFTNHIETTAPRQTVWDHVVQIDRWAPLFPGYQQHLEVAVDQFEWQIRGDVGAWSRLVTFHVTVEEWAEPASVTFSLKGVTEPVRGEGRFTIAQGERGSTMGFELTAEATGPTAPMVNALLNTFLAEHSGTFLERLRDDLETRLQASQPGADQARPAPPPEAAGTIVITLESPRTVTADRWITDGLIRRVEAIRGTGRPTRLEIVGPDRVDGRVRTMVLIPCRNLRGAVQDMGLDAPAWPGETGVMLVGREFARTVAQRREGPLRWVRRQLRRLRGGRSATAATTAAADQQEDTA
jgi:carbon monoxide dehydrogenase subunit G